MARPLRIEFPGAIYHVMSRGNARRRIFHDDRDHERLLEGLEQTVRRCGWELFSFVLMTANPQTEIAKHSDKSFRRTSIHCLRRS